MADPPQLLVLPHGNTSPPAECPGCVCVWEGGGSGKRTGTIDKHRSYQPAWPQSGSDRVYSPAPACGRPSDGRVADV